MRGRIAHMGSRCITLLSSGYTTRGTFACFVKVCGAVVCRSSQTLCGPAISHSAKNFGMTANLLKAEWTGIDSAELRLLLDKHIGGPGQYHDRLHHPNELYLPMGGSSCKIRLTFLGSQIVAVEPGAAFDAVEWGRISEAIEKSILTGPLKVGREYSFSSFRVLGSWRGGRSGVQIIPPPAGAPRAEVEIAEHPFVLEFPIRESDFWRVTNHRRMREHRKLTLLLNVLLAGHTSLQPPRSDHFWASVPRENGHHESRWAQHFFFGKLGAAVIDKLSPPAEQPLEEVEREEYYKMVGHDGQGLRVPSHLDESICSYRALLPGHRERFDRSTFWIDMASRQWNISVSGSFAALVSAIESLTDRGSSHHFKCPTCGEPTQHEVPGATRRFKDFLERFAPGVSLAKRRDAMYSLRSDILHGSGLMQLDQDVAFGWDAPWWHERELHDELWGLTRVALRNWLKNPPAV